MFMEILLWLAPSAVVTLAAVAWVSWAGRRRDHQIDRDAAAARMARALARPARPAPYLARPRPEARTRGTVGVRSVPAPAVAEQPPRETDGRTSGEDDGPARRAS